MFTNVRSVDLAAMVSIGVLLLSVMIVTITIRRAVATHGAPKGGMKAGRGKLLLSDRHVYLLSAHEKMMETCEMLRGELKANAQRCLERQPLGLVTAQANAYRELNTRLIEVTRKMEELAIEIHLIESGEVVKPTPVEDPYFET